MSQHQQPILRFFDYAHLPSHLKAVSEPFHRLAYHLSHTVPPGPETSAALRKLLEAKDCAVRAALNNADVTRAGP